LNYFAFPALNATHAHTYARLQVALYQENTVGNGGLGTNPLHATDYAMPSKLADLPILLSLLTLPILHILLPLIIVCSHSLRCIS
jgi:hypothetical protein